MALDKKAYTTLAEVKDDLSITASGEDSTLEALIQAASRAIDNFTRRKFWYESSVTHRVAIRGFPVLTVPRTPLISVNSITDREDSTTVDTDDYEIRDGDAGTIHLLAWQYDSGYRASGVVQDPAPGLPRRLRYEIDYEAGYETPAQSSTGAEGLPDDIQLACRFLATDFYRNRGENLRVKREHLLEAAYWYDTRIMQDDVLTSLLTPYRRLVQA